jgi:biopolymer transport protein ExbB
MPANHFSLARFWAQGDAISHAVAYVLLLMSLVSWYFILSKTWSAWRIRRSALVIDSFWAAPSMPDAIAALTLSDREGIYLPLVVQGARHSSSETMASETMASLSRTLDGGEQVTRVLRQEINRSTQRLESGLAVLASIGSTAPFVGLLGTVWGIYYALAAVSGAGTLQIDKVAGPVGEALIMTGFGLAVAIPAVLAYNGFNRVNRLTLAELDGFAHDLHAYLTKK